MLQRHISTIIIDRIPQYIHLRTDLNIHFRNKYDTKLFWEIFSSGEYIQLFSILSNFNINKGTIIDCGAGIGLFSLLLEHYIRMKVLKWENINYVLIEPSPLNIKTLESNFHENFKTNNYSIYPNIVGKKEGYENFYFNKSWKWSASIYNQKLKHTKTTTVKYIDLTKFIENKENIVLKMDIEGAEFLFFDNYSQIIPFIDILIIEWHSKFGNISQYEKLLFDKGFNKSYVSSEDKEYKVAMYYHC